jgi:ketosteroid isomerase-like protein
VAFSRGRRPPAAAALDRINRAWRERRPADLVPLFHPDITTVFPGFSGRAEGRDGNVAGFDDFCTNAAVHEYRESGHQIDVAGDTAVATFTYEMVYERDGKRSRASGRDLWVFARQGGRWLAVWRTMLDLAEQPA